MNEMLSYIFNTVKTNEDTIKQMQKKLKGQKRANRVLFASLIVVVAYICSVEQSLREQEERIQELNAKLDAGKDTAEGE